MKNCETSNAANANDAQIDLHKEIKEYFSLLGTPEDIHEKFWWMLYYSCSNTENNLDRSHDEKAMFLFYLTNDLIKKMYQSVMAYPVSLPDPANTISATSSNQ